ncbi:RraA family protein [Arenibaculum sp.]|jgi:regulator of RNase E activity RraA|uniref:RraA family protein n=1 Tax=Arenibaculum sp. TaxID=2865862 RepID=UPI002E14AD26|nr:RraA family protein [Arenibaculum sp.]
MAQWNEDEELFALIRTELATCPVSDVMEQLGFRFPMLPPEIRPLRGDMVMVGRAMPVQDDPPVPYGSPDRFDARPFGLLFESIEALRPNEVYIASGGPIQAARLGDMLTLRARELGAAGVVIDAHVRDANAILALGIPAFAHGTYAYGLQRRHNVVDYRCSIRIGEVRIRPGDLIFGDGDGVCVIPREAEEEIVSRAIEKNRLERKVRAAIEDGQSVVDAFKKYSVM